MTPFIIDTICLISFVTNRDPVQNARMDELFRSTSTLESELLIVSNVITEFVYVLQSIYETRGSLISEMITDLLANPGVSYHHGYFPDRILEIWPKEINDYGDAVIAAAATELNLPVYIFDKSFSQKLKKLNINCVLL